MRKLTLHSVLRAVFAKERRIFLYLFIMIFFIAFISLFANKWTSDQKIDKILITGNTFISSDEIESSIDSAIIDQLKRNVDFINIKDRLVKHPFIESSYVMHKKSSVIEIEINERIPLAILIKNNGNLCYVDETGCILPYRLSLKFGELPIIRGIFNLSKYDSIALAGAVSIIKDINQHNNNILQIISEIEFNKITKSYTFLTTDDGYGIFFGKAENIPLKLSILNDFLETEIHSIDFKKLNYIDVRWKDRVVLKYDEV